MLFSSLPSSSLWHFQTFLLFITMTVSRSTGQVFYSIVLHLGLAHVFVMVRVGGMAFGRRTTGGSASLPSHHLRVWTINVTHPIDDVTLGHVAEVGFAKFLLTQLLSHLFQGVPHSLREGNWIIYLEFFCREIYCFHTIYLLIQSYISTGSWIFILYFRLLLSNATWLFCSNFSVFVIGIFLGWLWGT